jgi:hypothetical protein
VTNKRLDAVRTALALLLVLSPLHAADAPTPAARIAAAADAFVASLDAGQRRSVLYALDDAQQRRRWSNFPARAFPRGGISLRALTPAQRAAGMALLASVLSPAGLQKVEQIMQGDEVLRAEEGGRMFGGDLYFFSILGTPSATSPWMLQFGGHHLALNITIAGERGVLTPSLTGAQPATYVRDGRTVRPLAGESDKAFALFQALDARQRDQAILDYRVADLVLGPGQDGRTIQPEGLLATDMNERQRAMLLDLISEWAGIVHAGAAATRLAEITAGLDATWFAWSGATTLVPGSNLTAYYRIQGPNLTIEYAPQRMGGTSALHIHAMYRDPTNDYGRKLFSQ